MKHSPLIHVGQCMTLRDVTPCPDCDFAPSPKYKKLDADAKRLRVKLRDVEAEMSRLFAEGHQRRHGVRP